MAARFSGLHTLLLNKYYVDEIYDATDRAADPDRVRGRAVEGRRRRVIDGAVNGVGQTVGRLERARCAACRPGRSAPTRRRCSSAWWRSWGTTCGDELMTLMPFPILTSLVALPVAGAVLLLFVNGDDERSAPLVRNIALVVSLLVFAETLLLWCRFNAASGDFQFVERHAWIPAFGIELLRRRRRHQPAAARADRLPDAARAARLVGVGPQADQGVLHLHAAARERDDRRVRLARPVPLLHLLGRDADPDVLPHRHLGLRAAHLRRRSSSSSTRWPAAC